MLGHYQRRAYGDDYWFLCKWVIPIGNNSMLIILIPKVKGASQIKNFRPISRMTSLYKTVEEVLSNRLKEVLAEGVDCNQCAL